MSAQIPTLSLTVGGQQNMNLMNSVWAGII